ncbi:hypothetical protein BH11MYX3_BH11MYX3_05120 [soil metagenome]
MTQQTAIIQPTLVTQWSNVVERPTREVLTGPLPVHDAVVARRAIGTNTLPLVTEILRRTAVPMTVRQLVEAAGAELPTRSKTPCTVVARDLAMDIKRKGEASAYVRTAPGLFTLRELVGSEVHS